MTRERFLVSFLVDARGGSMRSSRYSGLRILVPSSAASAPIRVTCRLQHQDRVIHPPQLNDGDGLACRILEMGPAGYKFNTPVLMEVPHYASLRNREREIVILRCDDGETWKEHTLEASDQAVHDAVARNFGSTLENESDLYSRRIVRILTTDFPQYFALVSRLRQETLMIDSQGGLISSTVVPQVQAVFPSEALQKRIRVGLQAQAIPATILLKLYGTRVAVSPVVTVEPRRRKFHKPITLTIPLPRVPVVSSGPESSLSASSAPISATNLRLLCSITGGTTPAHWEDITGSTPLTRENDCISFTTTVSARFWLIDCQNITGSTEIAHDLYKESNLIPYMGKFVVFSKRFDQHEAAIRCFCITDDKIDKTLECQEGFELRAASPELEVLHDRQCWLEFCAGNFIPVVKQSEMLNIHFLAFRENRLGFNVRLKDVSVGMDEGCESNDVGKVAFMRENRLTLANNDHITKTNLAKPICTLEVPLQKSISSMHYDYSPTQQPVYDQDATIESRANMLVDMHASLDQQGYQAPFILNGNIAAHTEHAVCQQPQQIARSDLDLADVANYIDSDWPQLARELGIDESRVNEFARRDQPYHMTCDRDRAHTMLLWWCQVQGGTGNDLERALRRIGREDVIRRCMYNIAPVTRPEEIAEAQHNLSPSLDHTNYKPLMFNMLSGDPNTVSQISTTSTSLYVPSSASMIPQDSQQSEELSTDQDSSPAQRVSTTTTITRVIKKTLMKTPISGNATAVDGAAEYTTEQRMRDFFKGDGEVITTIVTTEGTCDHEHSDEETISACIDSRHPVAVRTLVISNDSPENKESAYLDLINKLGAFKADSKEERLTNEFDRNLAGRGEDEAIYEEQIEKSRVKTQNPPAIT